MLVLYCIMSSWTLTVDAVNPSETSVIMYITFRCFILITNDLNIYLPIAFIGEVKNPKPNQTQHLLTDFNVHGSVQNNNILIYYLF